MGKDEELVTVQGLVKHFPVKGRFLSRAFGGVVHAVDNVSFHVTRGETYGLVGESGCGKTTLGYAILRLIEPTSGSVAFEGKDILKLDSQEMRSLRREMQVIFQDPYGSLDPRMKVGDLIREPLKRHGLGDQEEQRERVIWVLGKVGLREEHAERYPHEFSGGQRQRIGIARALALNPKFIVADEPVSALDVSVRSQILNLMLDLHDEFGLTYLFISHDLSVIKHVCDRVAVMYLGKIVESATKKELFRAPKHPYTEALVSAIPIPDPTYERKRIILRGDVPSPINPPTGCRFHPRCFRYIGDICENVDPKQTSITETHYVACHLFDRKGSTQ